MKNNKIFEKFAYDKYLFFKLQHINIGEIMAIPKYTELYPNVLKVLSDGKEHSIHEIKEIILDELNLTEDERNETIQTGIN